MKPGTVTHLCRYEYHRACLNIFCACPCHTTETETKIMSREINAPEGPALIYVHSDSTGSEIITTRVDWRPPEATQLFSGQDPRRSASMRERAVLRALLMHALFLLDTVDLPE